MPKLKEITDDLKLVLSKHQLSDDLKYDDRHLEYTVAKYRARGIRETFMRNGEINPTWIQDQGVTETTKVDKDDDPAIASCNCVFGKIVIPTVVNLPDIKGIYRVSSACRSKQYYRTTLERFMGFVDGSVRDNFNYFFTIGNAIYLHPYIKEANVQLILENPLEGEILVTHSIKTGDLEIGSIYTITSGSITHNSVKYQKGDDFTAVNADYTGNGVVKFKDQKRDFTKNDQYPIDHTMMEYIIMKILSQEFNIEERRIGDNRNDSIDETVRLQNE